LLNQNKRENKAMLEKILQGMASITSFVQDDRFLKFVGGICIICAGVVAYMPENSVQAKYINSFLLAMSGYGVCSSVGRVRVAKKLNGGNGASGLPEERIVP
jgi:hypothetical protein